MRKPKQTTVKLVPLAAAQRVVTQTIEKLERTGQLRFGDRGAVANRPLSQADSTRVIRALVQIEEQIEKSVN